MRKKKALIPTDCCVIPSFSFILRGHDGCFKSFDSLWTKTLSHPCTVTEVFLFLITLQVFSGLSFCNCTINCREFLASVPAVYFINNPKWKTVSLIKPIR